MKRIVLRTIVPLDSSDQGEQAIPHVLARSKGADLRVYLMRVTPHGEAEASAYLRKIRDALHR